MTMRLRMLFALLIIFTMVACDKKGSDSKNAEPIGLSTADKEKNLCLLKATGSTVIGQIQIVLTQRLKILPYPEPYLTLFNRFESCNDADENCLLLWSSSLIVHLFLMKIDGRQDLLYNNSEFLHEFESCQKQDSLCLLRTSGEIMLATLRMSITEEVTKDFPHLFDHRKPCEKSDRSCLIDDRADLAAADLILKIRATFINADFYRIEAYKQCYK
jgi:hypothetical protein